MHFCKDDGQKAVVVVLVFLLARFLSVLFVSSVCFTDCLMRGLEVFGLYKISVRFLRNLLAHVSGHLGSFRTRLSIFALFYWKVANSGESKQLASGLNAGFAMRMKNESNREIVARERTFSVFFA